MSEALINRLVEFAEAGNQQKIQIHGQTHQGWVMEITEAALLLSTGYSEKNGKEVWISFEDLQHAELFCWDNKNQQWTLFTL